MRQELINVYKFNELSEKVKEKVINRFREHEDYIMLKDNLTEMLHDELKKHNIEVLSNLKLGYSLSNSQGDGVNFTGVFEWDNNVVTITKTNYHYEHYKTVTKEYERFDSDNDNIYLSDEEYNKLDIDFSIIYKQICAVIESAGYDEIEYRLKESTIIENIEANDYEFYDNGDIF